MASICFSNFVSDSEYEISINTYDCGERNKGLATLTAQAFIDECMAKNLNPHWGTEAFRLPSIALAKKLGFTQVKEFPTYCFSFEEVNLEFLGHYYYQESRKVTKKEQLFGENLTAEDYYKIACGWSLAGDIQNAFYYLSQALEQGWKNIEQLQSEDLKRLHGYPQWQHCVKKCHT